MRAFKLYLAGAWLIPALFGCASLKAGKGFRSFPSKPIAKKASVKEQKNWEKIKSRKSLPLDQRIKDIDSFIGENEDKETALEAYLLKARLLSQSGKARRACLSYHKAVQSAFDYAGRRKAYLSSANCHFKEGNLKKALEVLERLAQNQKESLKNRKSAAKRQWDFVKGKKGFVQWRLLSLSHLSSFSVLPKERQKWMEKGKRIIDGLSLSDLISLAGEAPSFGLFEGYLLYESGRRFFEKKELKRAGEYFKKSLSASLPRSLKEEALRRLQLIKSISKANPYLIGVIVPLSGRSKALGQKILRGLYMGLDLDKDSPWQLMVMDSQSHPDVAAARLESLFYKRGAMALAGGLTSETAEALAKKAEEFALPAILFSQKRGLSLNRSFVYQNALTAEQLLAPLIRQTADRLKIKEAALLYPEDPYGEEYSALFAEMFKAGGGKIAARASYKPGETDFKEPIKNLLDLKGREKEFERLKREFLEKNPSLSERSPKLRPENLLPPKTEFSAIFIPDTLDQAKKIADHLKYFGLKDIYLLGTDLWRPKKARLDFPLAFVNLPEKESKKFSFYKEFMRSYSRPPGLFEQRAYNAALFLKQALSRGVKSRLDLKKELDKIKSFEGGLSSVAVSKDRIFSRPLNVYISDAENPRRLKSFPAP